MLLSHAKKPKKTQVFCELTDASGKIYFDNRGNLAVASGNYREIIIIARFLTPHNLAIIYLRLSR